MSTKQKVRKLLRNLAKAQSKGDTKTFNAISNQVHEVSDGEGLTTDEYMEWDCIREKETRKEINNFLIKKP